MHTNSTERCFLQCSKAKFTFLQFLFNFFSFRDIGKRANDF